MTGSLEDRLAHNEAVFRAVNERIEAGSVPRPADDPVAFVCECAMLGCNQLVEVTIADYEAVRHDPHRFLLVPGHEVPEVEVIVRSTPAYNVVEKVGESGREAARETHPRRE